MAKIGSAVPHGQFEGELAELAVGVLHGGEQVSLLEHVVSCPRCAAGLQHLEGVVYGLLSLVLEADPPAGFDRRALERVLAISAPDPERSTVHLQALRMGDRFSS